MKNYSGFDRFGASMIMLVPITHEYGSMGLFRSKLLESLNLIISLLCVISNFENSKSSFF